MKKISNWWKPFHALYIIEGNTGVTLHSKSYSNEIYNEDLISGMLCALESFINNLAYSNSYETLKEINYGESRIIYEVLKSPKYKNPIMAVAISPKIESVDREHSILRNLLNSFSQKYRNYLGVFKGNVKPFENFSHELENLSMFLPLHMNKLSKSTGLDTLIIHQSTSDINFPNFGVQMIDAGQQN